MASFMIRCPRCRHESPYRDGVRFCAACAERVTTPCHHCAQDNFPGDQHCAFCATPLSVEAAPVGPKVVRDELVRLAEAARARAVLIRGSAPPSAAHLTQADIDDLFS